VWAWGDVLAKQGKIKAAVAKYDAALKYAPNWKVLKETRETLALPGHSNVITPLPPR
jgi:hypothetical protein